MTVFGFNRRSGDASVFMVRKSVCFESAMFGLLDDTLGGMPQCHEVIPESGGVALVSREQRAMLGKLMRWLAMVSLFLSWLLVPGCIHNLRLRSAGGETLHGKYRFARENTGLIQVKRANGELLSGSFAEVSRTAFVESYEKTFGSGSITVAGLDKSPYGHLTGGLFPGSYGLTGLAYREMADEKGTNSATVLKGPLFYWTALLQGDRGTSMDCYFIGSSYTNHGFGSCKSRTGEEYRADF